MPTPAAILTAIEAALEAATPSLSIPGVPPAYSAVVAPGEDSREVTVGFIVEYSTAAAPLVSWPAASSIVLQVEAWDPAPGDLPKDNGPRAYGVFAPYDDDGFPAPEPPTYIPAEGDLPPRWAYDGSRSAHRLAPGGADLADPVTIAAVVVQRQDGAFTSRGGFFYDGAGLWIDGQIFNGDVLWTLDSDAPSASVAGTGDPTGTLHLVVAHLDGASDQIQEMSSGGAGDAKAVAGALSLSSTIDIGRPDDGDSWVAETEVACLVVWDGIVAGADIQAAFEAAYPGVLGTQI